MTIQTRSAPQWEVVKGSKQIKKVCPRCNNEVNFNLVYDHDTITWFDIPLFKTKTHYAIHCPVCIYTETISKPDRLILIGK